MSQTIRRSFTSRSVSHIIQRRPATSIRPTSSSLFNLHNHCAGNRKRQRGNTDHVGFGFLETTKGIKRMEEKQPAGEIALRGVLSNALKNIADSLSDEEFAEKMTFLMKQPKVVKNLSKALTKSLNDAFQSNLDEIFADGVISEGFVKLNELAIASEKANKDEIAWRPPGDVQQHMRSHYMQLYQEEYEKLEKIAGELGKENEDLINEIENEREVVFQIKRNVSCCLKDSSLALVTMDSLGKQLEDDVQLLQTF